MASGIYNRFKANLMNGVVDLEADVIYVSLYDNVHTFVATDTTYADVIANELPAAGAYATGGIVLAGKSVTEAATTKWDGTDSEWAAATFTAYHAVLYDDTAADNLICSIDFGGPQAVTAGTFKIQWDAAGLISLT